MDEPRTGRSDALASILLGIVLTALRYGRPELAALLRGIRSEVATGADPIERTSGAVKDLRDGAPS
jgi:hypothetical protein